MDKIFRKIFPDTFDRIVFLIENNECGIKDELISLFEALIFVKGTGKADKKGLLTIEDLK